MVLTEGNRWVVLMWFGEMDEADIVLSYENSLLYKDDVRLLEPPGWINDSIIEFVFEYFANEQFEEMSEDICFIAPQVSQFLKLCEGTN